MLFLNIKLKIIRKVNKDYQKRDDDILKGTEFPYVQEQNEDFWEFHKLDFTVARTDLLLASITDAEADQTFVPPLDGIE